VPLRLHVIERVATLRERLKAASKEGGERFEHADVIALTLLRAGVFRMRELVNPAHGDVSSGIRTLSPPSLVNAAVRCAQSDYSRWPISEITRARTPLEQAIDLSLHGKRQPEQARLIGLRGPEVDCDPRYRDVYALLLRDADPNTLFSSPDGSPTGTVTEVRLRCHAQLKRIDILESENLGGLSRAHLLQVREGLERSLTPNKTAAPQPSAPATSQGLPLITSVVPVGTAAATEDKRAARDSGTFISAVAPPPETPHVDRPTISLQPITRLSVAPPPPPPDAARIASAESGPRVVSVRPSTAAHEQALLEAAEPLLAQSRWRNLRMLLAADSSRASKLTPVLALLYAISLKEDQTLGKEKTDSAASPARAAETLAISVFRQLFGLQDSSVIALMFAKRLLRRRPLDWKQKPPVSVSAMLVGGALLLGALVGFLLHPKLLGLFWK
jgi:hypothetical protein